VSTPSSHARMDEQRIADGSTSKSTGAAVIPPVFSFSGLNLSVGKSQLF
jgi:hypothetical protein